MSSYQTESPSPNSAVHLASHRLLSRVPHIVASSALGLGWTLHLVCRRVLQRGGEVADLTEQDLLGAEGDSVAFEGVSGGRDRAKEVAYRGM